MFAIVAASVAVIGGLLNRFRGGKAPNKPHQPMPKTGAAVLKR